jgi:hypothetical protein
VTSAATVTAQASPPISMRALAMASVRERPSLVRYGMSRSTLAASRSAAAISARCASLQMPSWTAFFPTTSSRENPVIVENASLMLRYTPSDRRVTTVGCGLRWNIVWNRRSDARRASSATRRSCMSKAAASQRVIAPAPSRTGTTRQT